MQQKQKIKWIKKAQMWLKTTISYDDKNKKEVFKQEWSIDKPSVKKHENKYETSTS